MMNTVADFQRQCDKPEAIGAQHEAGLVISHYRVRQCGTFTSRGAQENPTRA